MRILQVCTSDGPGGAEKIAWCLFHACRQTGFPSWLAVGRKYSNDPDTLLIPMPQRVWTRGWRALGNTLSPLVGKVCGAERLQHCLHSLAQPRRLWHTKLGHEDFEFPGTRQLLDLPPARPDIVHCHNLHGGYFDLRALAWLSREVPVVLTLHDAWLLSGHCAHSLACEAWRSGCGHCPDLHVYPAIRRDGTAYNWRRKRSIYAQSRLFVTTPSQWLMRKVEQSILRAAILDAQVIPNGIDLRVFHPADRATVRRDLGLPTEAKILLFVANGIRNNVWKDYQTLRTALAQIAERCHGQPILFLALGEDSPPEHMGKAKVQFVPYQRDPAVLAQFYCAADVYVHAARADTFPNTVLEAMACGVPVVATAVGGIPEQVQDGMTGLLVPPSEPQKMAAALLALLSQEDLRKRLAWAAAEEARKRFALNRQVNDFVTWYQEVLQQWEQHRKPGKESLRCVTRT
jgi:glycosyltransferase involved in cell wall biosynthesis